MRELDIAAVGVGPFNLALAALADEVPELRLQAYDAKPAFDWHPGLLLDWATLQVSFLADLVSLVQPTSRWSFLSYLVDRDRMYPFYIAERFHIPRREYADYCGWVASSLPSVTFGTEVTALHWNPDRRVWTIDLATGAPAHRRVRQQDARNVVLGVGTKPLLPQALRGVEDPRLIHSEHYLSHVDQWHDAQQVIVVGSGQSGAEVFLDLLRRQRNYGWAITWATRTASFAPLDYSKLVLEYTTPEYMRYFHSLAPARRDELIESQWQLYKGIDAETIDAIHAELYEHMLDGDRPPVRLFPATTVDGIDSATGGMRLHCHNADTGARFAIDAGAVVAATGYAAEIPRFLDPVRELIAWDEQGRYQVSVDHRVLTDDAVTGGLFVQNAELHTHGAAAPDLGIGAYRSATLLNHVAQRDLFRLPKRTAFQTFGGVS